jgi:hypothetical protein
MGELGDGYEITRAHLIRDESIVGADPARSLLARRPELQPVYDAIGNAARSVGGVPSWWECDNRQPSRPLMEKHRAARRSLTQDVEFADSAAASGPRGLSLEQVGELARRAAFLGAQSVTRAINTGRVEAPEDMETLNSILPGVMAQHDPRWSETDTALLAQVIAEQPQLLPEDMRDMTKITNGLSTAAQIARGRQAEMTLDAYRRAAESAAFKEQAQTLSGAAGRPLAEDDDESFFQRLKAHAGNSYANKRAG